jgi:hypothetical protein
MYENKHLIFFSPDATQVNQKKDLMELQQMLKSKKCDLTVEFALWFHPQHPQ